MKNRLDELVKRWTSHHKVGIELRHDTGGLFLEVLGEAKKGQQEYGKKVVSDLSGQLNISTSELYRMRKFAEKFPNLEEFQNEHPDCTTWTAVKELLPEQSEDDSTEQKQSPPTPVTRDQVEKSAVDLHDKLDRFTGKGFGNLPEILGRLKELIDKKLKQIEAA